MTPRCRIGTAPDCDVRVTNDPYVSTHHATVFADRSGQVWVVDAGMATAMRVRAPVQLLAGDVIVVGRTRLPAWQPQASREPYRTTAVVGEPIREMK